jgi:hypothetical protein
LALKEFPLSQGGRSPSLIISSRAASRLCQAHDLRTIRDELDPTRSCIVTESAKLIVTASNNILLVRPAEPQREFIFHTSRDCAAVRRAERISSGVSEVAALPAWATNARKCRSCP